MKADRPPKVDFCLADKSFSATASEVLRGAALLSVVREPDQGVAWRGWAVGGEVIECRPFYARDHTTVNHRRLHSIRAANAPFFTFVWATVLLLARRNNITRLRKPLRIILGARFSVCST